jgi:integrase
VDALKAYKRPNPKNAAVAERAFITRYGFSWESKVVKGDSPISKEFAKLLKALKLHRQGVGFYALRHTFQTIGNRARDKDAVRAIMGHVPPTSDMSAAYTEEPVDDGRLRAVTDYVRQWLLGSPHLA